MGMENFFVLERGGAKMAKQKKSGPAIFMYTVIAITVVTAAVCFALYYSKAVQSTAVLWTGIVAFMIMYHFWVLQFSFLINFTFLPFLASFHSSLKLTAFPKLGSISLFPRPHSSRF